MAELRKVVQLLNSILRDNVSDPLEGHRTDPVWVLYTTPEKDALLEETPLISIKLAGSTVSEIGWNAIADVTRDNLLHKDLGYTKGYKHNNTYQITIWVKRKEPVLVTNPRYGITNEKFSGLKMCDYMAEQILDALMQSREYLRTQGVIYSSVEGYNEPTYDAHTNMYTKSITFLVVIDTLYGDEQDAIGKIEEDINSIYQQHITIQ